ncbi:MAG: histidine--tRNA ligase [Cuniculiplasma sp.]
MSKIEKLRGFKDYYPEDMEKREWIFQNMRKIAKNFGFQPIDYPSLEFLEMYRLKSGDELVNQTYSFTDKGNREITLIPEATPSTMRMLVARKDLLKPIKWYNIPKLWRYEEPQSGRNREHYQFNADYFGESGVFVNSEIISLACEVLNSMGLKNLYVVRVNHRKLMEAILERIGSIDVASDLSIIDHFRKESVEEISGKLEEHGIKGQKLKNLVSLLSKSYRAEEMEESLSLIDRDLLNESGYKELRETLNQLKDNGYENIVYDPATVRGLSYYTGIVFEGFDREGKFRSIFGGGRYDGLSELFQGPPIPAIGFGMGDAVLENILRENNCWESVNKDKTYFIIGIGMEGKKVANHILYDLRRKGRKVSMDYSDRNLTNSIKHASSMGFQYIILVGEKEMRNKSITLRDLASGEQKIIGMDNLGEI